MGTWASRGSFHIVLHDPHITPIKLPLFDPKYKQSPGYNKNLRFHMYLSGTLLQLEKMYGCGVYVATMMGFARGCER